jgi:hypothetical protein
VHRASDEERVCDESDMQTVQLMNLCTGGKLLPLSAEIMGENSGESEISGAVEHLCSIGVIK